MIENYFKIAIRKLMKNKVFSFINIIGLCAGITCCLLIALFVKHELNYDNFQEKGNRIARVIMEYSSGGNMNKGNYTSTKVGPSFKKNFPEVENFVRMSANRRVVRSDEKVFIEERFVYTDSTFFDLFTTRVLTGDKQKLLSGPNSIVLTESMAKKYFGNENPLGKTIKVSTAAVEYMITGIITDCPVNSQIKYDFLASFSSLGAIQEETYWNANYTTYLLLKNPTSIQTLQPKIYGFMEKEMESKFTEGDYLTYELEPFLDVHLKSEYAGFEPNGSLSYIYMIGAVAILILLLASFTFINLSTAASVERAKEIGVRKVSGAFRNQIYWQFIGESSFLVFLSTALSFVISIALLPLFNQLVNRQLVALDFLTPNFIVFALILCCSISFLAGAYPAFIISAFQPVKVLKGSFKNVGKGLFLRKSLFVCQFVISVLLVICSIIIHNQLEYLQNKNLGFNKDHIIVLPADPNLKDKFSSFKSELKKDGTINHITRADFEPCSIVGGYVMNKPEMKQDAGFSVNAGSIDVDYITTCGIKIIAGKDITLQDVTNASQEDYKKNYMQFILNESAAKQMGWSPEDAIGKKMALGDGRPGEVKAVVQDFHFESLHQPIKPVVLFPSNYYPIKILIKVSGNNIPQSLATIEKTWKTFLPNRPFEYSFLDENYMAKYKSEIRLGQAVTTFTTIAIILALLGLYGLAAYSIQQRTKEIGILKVLGAPVSVIVARLSKSFIVLILAAITIAVPISIWAMTMWLQDFSYKITLSPWPFVLAGTITILLSILTIASKAIKSAITNPVKNLRTE